MRKFLSENFSWFLVLALIVALFVFNESNMKLNREVKEKSGLISSLQDTLKVVRNRDSSLTATISTLETDNVKQFLNLQVKDSSILALQNLVKDYKSKLREAGSSATKLTTDTKVDTKSPTQVNPRDTVKGDSLVYIYPSYKSEFNLNNWVEGTVFATRDTTTLRLIVRNDYDVIIGSEGGLFKKRKTFVEVTSHNPYSEIKTLRTYRVSQPPPKRWGIGIQAGYGLTLSDKPILTPYIGIGVSHNLIRF